jgi:diguanylate cyclase (GGDEF)-like protein
VTAGGAVPTGSTAVSEVLSDVVVRLGGSLDLQRTLQQVTDAVVDRLGFEVAVLNLVDDDGDLVVSALTGPEELRQQLSGRRHRKADWQQLLAGAQHWGRLRFVDGRSDVAPEEMFFWVPDIEVGDDEDAWHPLDALFAPLHAADGRLVGTLSVDLPRDGRRPDRDRSALLEVFAVQAALAIDHARMYTELQDSLREQARAQDELLHRAFHDSLTGLPNRELLLDRLDHALARARRSGTPLAVVFLDLDHFKLVNDSLGHLAGDELLVAVAALLSSHLRQSDTAARLGGDEFVLVLEDLAGPAEAIAVAERLLAASRQPVEVAGESVRSSLSIGIALATDDSTPSTLLAEADTALYRAKAAGRGRWELFDAAMRSEALAQLALRAELGQALPEGQWRLHYQPVVDLVTGRRVGLEALLRWQHPTRGLLAPGDFLDVLEDSDLDGPVTDWVIHRACADAASWAEVDGEQPFVSVNVSPRQLSRADLASRVGEALRAAGLEPGRLWVEITEDRPIDERQDVADVQRLRDLGVHVALDDFGTGYAGLTYLQRLPVDTVKVDRVFVAELPTDPVSRSIVRAVVGLAAVLHLRVVAEASRPWSRRRRWRSSGSARPRASTSGDPRSHRPRAARSRPRARPSPATCRRSCAAPGWRSSSPRTSTRSPRSRCRRRAAWSGPRPAPSASATATATRRSCAPCTPRATRTGPCAASSSSRSTPTCPRSRRPARPAASGWTRRRSRSTRGRRSAGRSG